MDLVIGFFGAGLLVGAIFRSPWAFAFPLAVTALIVWRPLGRVGVEAPDHEYLMVTAAPAALGVLLGIVVGRGVRRFAKLS
jgi:hypothetical protein